jgi:hypothetical protein
MDADQVTEVFVVVPCTAAAKETVVLMATLAFVGEIVTELTGAVGGGGFVVGETAVAESGTSVGEELALVTSARLPVMVPGASGLNATAKVFAEPGSRTAGKLRPEVLKPFPVTVIW